MSRFTQDLRYAFRTLTHSPGYTAAALLSLALGIGANTAIFTLTNAVFLHSLPVREPSRIMDIVTVDHATRKAVLALAVDLGARAKFGHVTAVGAHPIFTAQHLARIARFRTGDEYDAALLDDFRRALIATVPASIVKLDVPEEPVFDANEVTCPRVTMR